MITIVHSADLHLDAPFGGLTPEQSAARRQGQRDHLDKLAQLTIQKHADLLLLAGDLFDSGQTYYETTLALTKVLGNLSCPVLIAPGNHDYYHPRSPYALLPWPSNVHIFTTTAMEAIPFPHLGCTVHGAAFTSPYRDTNPLEGFCAPSDGTVHIGLVHGQVEEAGRYSPISKASIGQSGLTYLALGHVHQASGLCQQGGTHWSYPGCLEGRGFDETGDKGATVVTIDQGTVTSEFVPLATRRYHVIPVDVTNQSPEALLLSALPAQSSLDIIRFVLTGQSLPLDLAALSQIVSPHCYSLSLRDRTRPLRPLWERIEEDSLTGMFLRNMSHRRAALSTPEEQEELDLAVTFGLAALENGEDCRP